jgi:UDP-N-acetylmuramate--alanine ligase
MKPRLHIRGAMKRRLHMIGIGGVGMSALAQILLEQGAAVSGSDARESETTRRLAERGARIEIGHQSDLVEGAGRVIVSDAVTSDNPEVMRARDMDIPVSRRSELLAEMMQGMRGIAISGTHGKTTVTAMVGAILAEAGLDPTVAIGGDYAPFGGNARTGRGEWFVAEACEAYGSFLDLRPEISLVTNIEADHLDYHETREHLRKSFLEFLERTTPGGCLVLCADRPELRSLSPPEGREVIWYGADAEAQIRGSDLSAHDGGGRCRLWVGGRDAGELRIAVPGHHNLVNALGAVAAAVKAGASTAACLESMAGFAGVGRRFELLGETSGMTLVDDYAHHPTEVEATIAAARGAFPGRRLVAIFQPHLYSRTRDFAEEFASALSAADLAVLTEIYPAREAPLPGVTSALIMDHLRTAQRKDGVLEVAKADLTTALPSRLRPGDVVLFMGAGDIGSAARSLFGRLSGRAAEEQEVVVKE